MGNRDGYLLRAKTRRRAYAILVAFALFLALLITNVIRLDILGFAYYKDKAYDQITTTAPLSAERGKIYDANMNLLATTRTTWRIFLSPRQIREKTRDSGIDYPTVIASGLSQILGESSDTILKKAKDTAKLDVTVKKATSEEEYRKVLNFITENQLSGLINIEAESARFYPEGTLAAHVLGFTGSDNQGLYGLEYQYENLLRGKDGYYLYAKDANGNEMPGEYSAYVDAEDGFNIVTTIDSFVQKELEAIIEKARINHSASNRVTGVVMDTETGAILAMATTTPFDPNDPFTLDALSLEKLENSGYREGSEEYKRLKGELLSVMWSNKAISETYEPGSTFKIITVAAALDSGCAKESDTFSCNGYHLVGGWRIKCHKTTGHGSGFDLGYGLKMSCNPTMMTIAERMGADTFYSYVDAFGYLEKSGIDLPSEASSIFHKKENIGSTELATASFGQRFKVTIINHLSAIASVANGGTEITPYLLDRVIGNDGTVVWQHENKEGERIISKEVAQTVSNILEDGVSGEGGAKNAYVDGYKIAAKTGTSQKFEVLDENGNSYLRIGSTVAYAPVNGSGIAVIIVVDEPQSTVKYGSTVAAPYVGELMRNILPYLGYDSASSENRVPVSNYVGMNINSAKGQLDKSGIKYTVIGNGGTVISQCPAPTEKGLPSPTVFLYTSEIDEYTEVPELVGMTLSEAVYALSKSGLNLYVFGIDDIGDGLPRVVDQSIASGKRVKRGSVIELTVLDTGFTD